MRTDDLTEHRFTSVLGAIDVLALHLGDRLGLYTGAARGRSRDGGELAAGAGIDKRYAREWLEQQTVAGLLEVDAAHASPKMRRQRHAQQGGSRGCSPL
jgi:hypothetical protein